MFILFLDYDITISTSVCQLQWILKVMILIFEVNIFQFLKVPTNETSALH